MCKICKKETKFKSIYKGYKNCCSKECSIIYTYNRTKKSNLEKYGVFNPYQRNDVKEKSKKTCLKNYGVKYSMQSEEIRKKGKKTKERKYNNENYINLEKRKQTCLEKYGVDHIFKDKNCKEKRKQTWIKKYGVEYPSQNKEVKLKTKRTNLKKLGVEYPMQNKLVLEKSQKSGYKLKQFKNTNLWYQGTFELDFLNSFYNLFPDIQRGPTVKYKLQGNNHYYFPDFYIPSLNLIIEIKNLYRYKLNLLKIKIQEKFVKENNFNYILILDKNYKQFNNLING